MKFDDEEINQMEFKSKLGATRVKGNKSHKQLSTIETFLPFQNSRNSKSRHGLLNFIMIIFKRYKSLVMMRKVENKCQLHQRLTIAFAQVKAVNTSENLLNEMC